MIEPNRTPESVSPDAMRVRSVNMLRRAIQRFKENVTICDLDNIAAECPTLHDELTQLVGLLEIGDMWNRRAMGSDDD